MFIHKRLIRKLALFSLIMALIHWNTAMVQSLEYPPMSLQIPMTGNALKTSMGDILLDNFEYWDSPLSHGWHLEEPDYPVYGVGIGYGLVQGVLDFEEGSRVLNVYRPPSVFLPFNSPYMPYTISKAASYPDGNTQRWIDANNPELSFKIRAPLAVEEFDTFSFEVIGGTTTQFISGPNAGENHFFQLILIPRENPLGIPEVGIDALEENGVDLEDDPTIRLYLGKQFQDGTWHTVNMNIARAVQKATGENLANIQGIRIRGNQYRLDDIIFFKKSPYKNRAPYLFRIGPVYCQLYDTTGQYSTKLIFAEDPDLGEWCLDADGTPLGFCNGEELDKPPKNSNLLTAYVAYYTDEDGKKRLLDAKKGDPLAFNITVGGLGAQGTAAPRYWSRVPLRNPATNAGYNPPLIPYIPKLHVPATQWLNGENVKMMQTALINCGFQYWPNVIVLHAQGQVLEDLIVTCEVTDGRLSDSETFSLSVINYPVTNNPPRLEQLSDQCFEVLRVPKEEDIITGGLNSEETITNVYAVTATDPDWDILTYSATLNGLSSYQYGPWAESIIDPSTGVISFTPQFEGVFECMVTVRDSKGMAAFGSFNLFCINKGTWFNHPPIIVNVIESPQRCRAGEFFTLSELSMFDPDDEKLFYSCNTGAVSEDGVFSFQTLYPGDYLIQITAYDITGGYAVQEFILKVSPWWSL